LTSPLLSGLIYKVKKKHRKSAQKFVFIFAFTLALFLVSSSLISSLADKLVLANKIEGAVISYKLSKALNPLNQKADQGVRISEFYQKEKTSQAEESGLQNLAQDNQRYVLGASATVPVLMYHYIRYADPNDKVGVGLSVTPWEFSRQMDYLESHGYHTISLDELGANLLNDYILPSKPIVITFDDGYRDAYTEAYPILKAHGLKAVEFVITGFVGGASFLTWGEIKQMSDSGVFTFEAHTVDHYALTYLSDARALKEMTDSKNDLKNHLGYPINWIAYPYGNVDARIAKIATKAGFVGGFGTNFGSYLSRSAMFTLPRIRVGEESPQSLAKRLPY